MILTTSPPSIFLYLPVKLDQFVEMLSFVIFVTSVRWEPLSWPCRHSPAPLLLMNKTHSCRWNAIDSDPFSFPPWFAWTWCRSWTAPRLQLFLSALLFEPCSHLFRKEEHSDSRNGWFLTKHKRARLSSHDQEDRPPCLLWDHLPVISWALFLESHPQLRPPWGGVHDLDEVSKTPHCPSRMGSRETVLCPICCHQYLGGFCDTYEFNTHRVMHTKTYKSK